MANIFTLALDVILYIFRFLNIEDRIAFALSCQRFKLLCMDGRVFRKVDLSTHPVVKTQRGAISKFFRDKQMVHHITKLNISNCRVLNWKIDDHLENFIISICSHLEELHVLNCGMSYQRLHCILKQAPKLTSLSWSLWDFIVEDIEFLVKSIESDDRICLRDIKHLHLETFSSKPHIQIADYLVLSCCQDIEELKVNIWQIDEDYYTALRFTLSADQMNPSTSIADVLERLHSLTVVALRDKAFSDLFSDRYKKELCNFISSVVRKKSQKTNWRKLWISPPIGTHKQHDSILRFPLDCSLPFHEIQPDELQSIEEISARACWSFDEVNKLKILFQSIRENSVRRLHLCQPLSEANPILELCEPVLRVTGHSLKFLSLSFGTLDKMPSEITIIFHKLFSNCPNITELDLLYCYFEKDICEPFSNLTHLTKVQLTQCAISSKHCLNTKVEISKANILTFVENCKNITHLDVRGCSHLHKHISCPLTDGDLLALAKLSNLESLTLFKIYGIREWTFLQNISEHCKFLAMLRNSAFGMHFDESDIPILLESVKFLKHLAIKIPHLFLQSECFWNLLSHAKNLERLCIRSWGRGFVNIPVAVKTLNSLPRLHILHLHDNTKNDVDDFSDELIGLQEEAEDNGNTFFGGDGSPFFEIVMDYTDYENCSLDSVHFIPTNVLPLNVVELCSMTPIISISRF